MGGFKASFINEIDKMYRRKKAVAVAVLSLLVIVFGQLAIIAIRMGLGIRGVSSTEFPILVLSIFVNTVLPLFTALVAADTFAGEFSQNTMKLSVMRPVTRLKLFAAKVSAVGAFAAINLFLVMVLSTVTGLVFNTAYATPQGFMRILISYAVSILPVMTLALGIVVLANILKSGTSVLFLSVILFIACKGLGIIFSQYSSLFITSLLGWHSLWLADTIPLLKILRLFLIMLGYSIMFFTAGFYLFDKRDF